MSGRDEPRAPHAHSTSVRVGGAMLMTGGMLAVILTAVGPGFVNGQVTVTLCAAAVAITVGVGCMIRPAWIRPWMLPCFALLAVGLVALSSLMTRTATDGSEMLYLWTVLYGAYFMPDRYALLTVGFVSVAYPAVAISILGRPGVVPSAYVVGTSIVTLLIVSGLRRRLGRVVTDSAREARTDGLTGLTNRRCWDESVARELAVQARRGTALCMLMVDIDHFKRLNDAHGHAAGDAALTGVAVLLRTHARQSDVLARIGGEEFGLLLPGCAAPDAVARAEEIRLAVQRGSADWTVPITVSIGVAAAPGPAPPGTDLVRDADRALYAAKAAGRNTVRAFGVAAADPAAAAAA